LFWEHLWPWLPGYLDAVDAHGDRVAETTMSHADRIRVSPIAGCAYDCRFCDLAADRYRTREPAQILAGIDVALADRSLPPRHLLISGGSPARGERHLAYFDEACRRIVRHVRAATAAWPEPFEIDIMMSARADGPGFVDRMVDEGVTGFSLNVEVFDERHAMERMPLKHRFARPHLAATIARAVERLGAGSGRVRSLIIPGLEPPEETLRGVEWLASLGCSPVISPFRPARGTALAREAPVDPELLRELLREARAIAARTGVPLGPRCVPCQHNTLTLPWDTQGTG
ncbi:MAG TPA: radical SAM protein, partial [Conexibacter sp.]|nr:radical SAM protein [Conexibacter sp.]